MKNTLRIMLAIFMYLIFNATSACQSSNEGIHITGARIIDGSGRKAFKANLYIEKDKIAAIDTTLLLKYNAAKTIDAAGKVVTPGFIDVHSHGNPLTHGPFKNFLAMGVTTITLGQDGFSPAVENLAVWKDSVERQGVGPNIAMFIGHGTLRSLAGVGNTPDISAEQLSHMSKILSRNFPYIFGMSTGLEYAPALYAGEQELLALARVLGKADKMIMSHMRNEDNDAIMESIQELLRQGEYTRVHIAHLKSVYGKGADRAREILNLLYKARQEGVAVTADVYPYTASYTGIAIVFPDWAKTNEQFEGVKESRRSELEDFIVKKVNARNGPQSTLFGTKPYQGKNLKQVADEMNLSFEQVLIDSIGPEGGSAAYFVMNKELQYRFIKDPLIVVSSDGSPTSFHPRGHGTFAKLIEEFVVQDGDLSLEEAVKKVTSQAATIIRLKKRGEIKVGNFADVNIFDPEKVHAVANYGNPHQLAQGFEWVIVNGKIAKNQDNFNDELSGKVLTP